MVKRQLSESCSSDSTTTNVVKKNSTASSSYANLPPKFDLYLKALQLFNETFRHDKQVTWPKFGQVAKKCEQQQQQDNKKLTSFSTNNDQSDNETVGHVTTTKNDDQQDNAPTTGHVTTTTTGDDHVTQSSDHVTQSSGGHVTQSGGGHVTITAYNYWEYLDSFVRHVAKTGRTIFEWKMIKNYLFHRLDFVLQEMVESELATPAPSSTPIGSSSTGSGPPDTSTPPIGNTTQPAPATKKELGAVHFRILREFGQLRGCPFTIQRLAELMAEPRKHYKRAEKFFRAVEKNLLIVTMVKPDGERETFPPAGLSGLGNGGGGMRNSAAENYPRDAFSALLLPSSTNAAGGIVDDGGGGVELSASAAKRPKFSPPHSTTADNAEMETDDDDDRMTSSPVILN